MKAPEDSLISLMMLPALQAAQHTGDSGTLVRACASVRVQPMPEHPEGQTPKQRSSGKLQICGQKIGPGQSKCRLSTV